MEKTKERIFTFKTDKEMADRLQQIPNRSEFIRKALIAAFKQCCPLCQGTGTLSPEQQKHWQHFLTIHSLEKCDECNAIHFVCRPGVQPELH